MHRRIVCNACERETHTAVSAFVLQFQRRERLIGATRTIKRSERQLKVVWRVLIKKVGRDGDESGVELTQEALTYTFSQLDTRK